MALERDVSAPYFFILPADMDNMTITDSFWQWVTDHAADDEARLWLKYGSEHRREICQVLCRRKYARKLADTLSRYPHFYFPTELSGEQCTSDALAAYHATLITPGNAVADLTAGLGIDAIHLARVAASVLAVERDSPVAEALHHNAAEAGIGNVTVVCDDCRNVIAAGSAVDAAFIDPARRDSKGGRVYALQQCEPDVTAMMPTLERFCKRLIIKMSPMLDIAATAAMLPPAARFITLGTTTECKELIAVIDFSRPDAQPTHSAVTLDSTGAVKSAVEFTPGDEAQAEAVYGLPTAGDFFYEPYPAVMKAGALKMLCSRYGVAKLHPNTHFFFSSECVTDFPGDILRVTEVLPFSSAVIKQLRRRKARMRVSARNFDMTADRLRARLAITDGGDLRLFGVTAAAGDRMLIIASQQ